MSEYQDDFEQEQQQQQRQPICKITIKDIILPNIKLVRKERQQLGNKIQRRYTLNDELYSETSKVEQFLIQVIPPIIFKRQERKGPRIYSVQPQPVKELTISDLIERLLFQYGNLFQYLPKKNNRKVILSEINEIAKILYKKFNDTIINYRSHSLMITRVMYRSLPFILACCLAKLADIYNFPLNDIEYNKFVNLFQSVISEEDYYIAD